MEIQQIRRSRLKQWIAEKFPGKRGQAAFIEDIASRTNTEINQGELSGVIRGKKSFGEKKARNYERLAAMPENWLDGESVTRSVEDGANAPRDPRTSMLAAYFYWLTEAEKKKIMEEVRAMADGNMLVLKQLSGKLNPPSDIYVDSALNGHKPKNKQEKKA
jgi:hypothetical protein